MTEHEASRTLVKSAPELWAECSDAGSLARHLGQFGDIRITRLEPETSVAWEGDRASGTVKLEPSGWGTRVILTARPVPAEEEVAQFEPEESPPEPEPERDPEPEAEESPPDPEPEPQREPEPEAEPEAPTKLGFMARLRAKLGGKRDPSPEPAPTPRDTDSQDEPEPTEQKPTATSIEPAADPEPSESIEPEQSGELVGDASAEAPVEDETAPPAATSAPPDPAAALTAALDSLGQAHHRPFSRA